MTDMETFLKVLNHFFNCEIYKISGKTLSVKNTLRIHFQLNVLKLLVVVGFLSFQMYALHKVGMCV